MEKLISLLNEYKEDALYVFVEYNKELHGFDMLDDGKNTFLGEETILWKRYGFIKWLVDNDKIEFREGFYLEDQHGGGFGEDENIIMLLSIQDNPIEFLLSILK